MKSQKLEVGNNSQVVQATGDVNIQSPSYSDLKEIFYDLFELNFPRVQEIAKQEAVERVNKGVKKLEKAFKKHQRKIDPSKFTEPNIQYELQNMAIDVARKGEKSNMDLMCDLLCIMMEKDTKPLTELVAAEARKILPLMTKRQISYLALEFVIQHILFDLNVQAYDMHNQRIQLSPLQICEQMISPMIPLIQEGSNLNDAEKQYLCSIGGCVQRGIVHKGVIPSFLRNIPEFNKKQHNEVLEVLKSSSCPNLAKLVGFCQSEKPAIIDLTLVGKLIAIQHLASKTPIDHKMLFE